MPEPSHPSNERSGLQSVGADALLRLLLEEARDHAAFVLDADGRIASWNEGARRLFGHAEAEALGLPLSVLYPAEQAEAAERHLATAAETGRAEDEGWRVRGDGLTFWAAVTLEAVRDETGCLHGFALLAHDLTERRRVEERARFETRLLGAVEHALVATDPEGTIIFWNPQAERLYGWRAEEVLGRSMVEVTPAGASRKKAASILRRLRAGRSWSGEFLAHRRDGSTLTTMVSCSPIVDEMGRLIGTVGVSTDLTERKAVEQALREEANLVETLHRVGGLLAAELDVEAVVQTVTDAATQLTAAQFGAFFYNVLNDRGESYQLYTISGVPREAFSRFPMPRNTPIFAPTFRGEGVVRSDDITRDPRYGQMEPYRGMPRGHLPVRSYLAVPVISRTGEVLGGLFFGHEEAGVFRERHERIALGIAGWAAVAMDNAKLYEAEHRARAEAEAANRAKSDFLAVMSHELRTPLGAVLGYADLLNMGISGSLNEGQARQVDRIKASARHLLHLIEEILTFSRVEAGREALSVETVELAELVEDVQTMIEPLAAEQGLEFRVHLPREGVRLETDPGKLRQVLLNLLSNAVKFTPSGWVELGVEVRGGTLGVRVSDSGIGIAPEHRDRIFEAFWQADQGITRSVGGTGLGLSVVHRLVGMMGGEISVESEPGEGSTFVVQLPLHAPEGTAGSAEEA